MELNTIKHNKRPASENEIKWKINMNKYKNTNGKSTNREKNI